MSRPKPCTGRCWQYSTGYRPGDRRYAHGRKYCKHCEVFMESDEKKCPCCGNWLRIKPRDRSGRRRGTTTAAAVMTAATGRTQTCTAASGQGRGGGRK